jgi:WD40 repeat protein
LEGHKNWEIIDICIYQGRGEELSLFAITNSNFLLRWDCNGFVAQIKDQKNFDFSLYAIASNSKYVVVGGSNGTLHLYNPKSLHLLNVLPPPKLFNFGDELISSSSSSFSSFLGKSRYYPDVLCVCFTNNKNGDIRVLYSDKTMMFWEMKETMTGGGGTKSAMISYSLKKSYSAHSSCVYSIDVFPGLVESYYNR